MAKPNYSFEKRQRDLAKKKQQDEKRQKKLAKKAEGSSEGSPADSDDEADGVDGDASASD